MSNRTSTEQQRSIKSSPNAGRGKLSRWVRDHNLTARLGWFVPNGGTLIAIILLILTQGVWARPAQYQPLASSTAQISYQGQLTDASSMPLSGSYDIKFRLYDAPVGGILLWEEEWAGPNAVQVSNGLFGVMLGSLNPTLQTAIANNDNVYLGITVDTDGEMAPRVQLGSVPFAMQASTISDGSVTTDKIADGAVTEPKLASGTFDNISVAQENVIANVQVLHGDTEKSVASTGYVDLFSTTVDVNEPSTLRISFHSIVWKTLGVGRTALGIRINGDPNTNPNNNSFVQTGTIDSNAWTKDGLSLGRTFFVDVPSGTHTVTLVLASWDSGTSHARAYGMNVEVLKQ